MKFRLRAFGLHLLGSTAALSITLGALYLGWYRWPGWYLSDVPKVVAVMIGVDVVIGPLITLIIANPKKPRRVLARDIAIIATAQVIALGYGATALWNGRPLYYAFSVNCLQVVQAYDIDAKSRDVALSQNLQLAPHWYSTPRWIWAPLPEDPAEAQKIVASVMQGGSDVIGMPQYYKTWREGLPALRAQLKSVDDVSFFSRKEKTSLKERMHASGFAPENKEYIPLTGRGPTLLAVVDPTTLQIKAIIKPT
jgi:hypothetical protein